MNITPGQLKAFVLQHETSMKDFAEKTGYSAETIRRMCSGKYPISQKAVLRIARTYPSVAEFFPEEAIKSMIMETSNIHGYKQNEKVKLVKKLQNWYKEGDEFIDRLKEILLKDED
jgi:plasmid maintenance system antidote protein VapI